MGVRRGPSRGYVGDGELFFLIKFSGPVYFLLFSALARNAGLEIQKRE